MKPDDSPYIPRSRFGLALVCVSLFAAGLLGSGCSLVRDSGEVSQAHSDTVRVAVVHFAPRLGEVAANRRDLERLTREAAENGAKIVVHTEMATSGYSFFSRAQVATVAEPVPGPTTAALGAVALRYGIYVVVGLPVVEERTGRYFNSAVLIGPGGRILGVYRKRGHLLESSYNSAAMGEIPSFDTPYGRLGIVICADLFYAHFPRLAAVAETDILLAPANVGVTSEFLRVRAYENGLSVLVANRYGREIQGTPRDVFDQNTFTIPSPFPYDFSFGSRSAVVGRDGTILVELTEAATNIGYADLQLRAPRSLPAVRRPDLYTLLSQDTLEPYTFSQLHLPEPAKFAVAAVDPGDTAADSEPLLGAVRDAVAMGEGRDTPLRLVVLPRDALPYSDDEALAQLQEIAASEGVDLVLGLRGTEPSRSLLLTSTGETYSYDRTHRRRDDPPPTEPRSDHFLVVDRPYARLAILQGRDLLAPETSLVMAKMGVDLLAVSADDSSDILSPMWKARSGDYVHLAVANRRGLEGVYLGGFQADPSNREGEGVVLMDVDTQHVRNKKEPRFVDVSPLLEPCDRGNC